jgi:hypothetical protein
MRGRERERGERGEREGRERENGESMKTERRI